MSYSASDPIFIRSIQPLYDNSYHYFGIIVTLYLLIFYIVKGVSLDPKGKDKGQLIAHVLFMKAPVLALYPTYA